MYLMLFDLISLRDNDPIKMHNVNIYFIRCRLPEKRSPSSGKRNVWSCLDLHVRTFTIGIAPGRFIAYNNITYNTINITILTLHYITLHFIALHYKTKLLLLTIRFSDVTYNSLHYLQKIAEHNSCVNVLLTSLPCLANRLEKMAMMDDKTRDDSKMPKH